MLIPFLPYLLAVAGLSGLLALPAVGLDSPGWALAALYAVLPLLGAIAGELPEGLLGGRYHSFLRRRMLYLAAWLGVLVALPLAAALRERLAWTGDGDTAALGLLLLNFWVGDALSTSPLNPLRPDELRARLRRFGQALRLPVPILVLMLCGLALPVLSDTFLLGEGSWTRTWLRLFGALGGMLLLAAVAVPVLIRVCWGLRPLASGEAEQAVRGELAANGVKVGSVLAWPDELTGNATAGVIGLLPRFRYLLISPSLLRALSPGELRSVIAHEAGHIKHRHLWYFFAAILAFILLMQVLATALVWGGLFTGGSPPGWLLIGVEVAALLLFFRFGVGYLSRHFERQADGNAVRRLGAESFEGAIVKVGLLNGIPLGQDNWHHYGIERRIDYVHGAQADPERLRRHDRKVTRIKRALLLVLLLGLGAQVAASSPAAMGWLGERYLAQRLDGEAKPSRADVVALQFLATRAMERGDHAAAERYFRMVLRVTPDDPQALNNLAWVLVTQPAPDAAALSEGVHLAERAAHAEEQAYIWDTLAESYYRSRRYDLAEHAAAKALVLARQGAGRGDAPLTYYSERLAAFSRHGQGA